MVRSKTFVFIGLFCSAQAVLGKIIPRSAYEPDTTSASIPSASIYPSAYSSSAYIDREYPLSLHLDEPAVMQVINHGANDTKIIVHDNNTKVGETSLLNNTHLVDMDMINLAAGNHTLYLTSQFKNGTLSAAPVDADVKFMTKSHSRIIKRWDNDSNDWNEHHSGNNNSSDYNAVVEWEIDPEEEYDYYEKDGLDYDNEDDEYDEDSDDEYDEDEDEEDDCNEDHEESDDSWKWNNKEGWKSNHGGHHKHHKHNKIIKVIVTDSNCPTAAPTTVTETEKATPSICTSASTTPPESSSSSHSSSAPSSSLPSSSVAPSSSSVAPSSSSEVSSSSSEVPSSSSEAPSSSSEAPSSSSSDTRPSSSSTPQSSSSSPSSSSSAPVSSQSSSSTPSSSSTRPTSSTDDDNGTTVLIYSTIQGIPVTIIEEGQDVTVTDAREVTVVVGGLTTTTEKETVVANTITFDIDTVTVAGLTVTQPGATVTQAGATQTLSGATETVTVAGPPVTYVALTETVQGPSKTVTKYLLQQTVRTTVITQASDIITVTQTQLNPTTETIYGSTVTSTENVVITVVRPQSTSTATVSA